MKDTNKKITKTTKKATKNVDNRSTRVRNTNGDLHSGVQPEPKEITPLFTRADIQSVILKTPSKTQNALRTIVRLLMLLLASGVLTAGVEQIAGQQSQAVSSFILSTWAALLSLARAYVEDKTGKAVLVSPPVTRAALKSPTLNEIGGA